MSSPKAPPTDPRLALATALELLRAAGVEQAPRREPRRAAPASARPAEGTRPAAASPAPTNPATPGPAATEIAPWTPRRPQQAPLAEVRAAPSLEVLNGLVRGCTACSELASTRTQTVFGVGPATARLCFLGEAPGADEDRLGEPFVGRAGQLLDRIIEACGLKRSEVYILNVLKCRPPGNRNPAPDEAANCRGFLERQLELVDPEFVCCLGAVAAQNFLETADPIGRLRGKVHEHRGRRVVCTYHPAYLLRNPSAKKATWDDMKLLMRQMGVEL
jgi:DNA polymerase